MSKPSVIIPGFSFASISAGIKKSGAEDLALVYSEKTAVTAGVFTTNKIKAAPVIITMKRIASQRGQAIIINSGNANACTGKKGYHDASEMTARAAEDLGVYPDLVYASSTGVIGRPLPMDKIRKALPQLARKLSPSSLEKIASAIMTTDTFAKISSRKIPMKGKTGTIAGIAKGAGMICPNMATMLCFIFTDIAVRPDALKSALGEAVTGSFNRISIDNDMSTNDMALIMANGSLKNIPLARGNPLYVKFKDALTEITYDLARMIVEDGEGASKFVEIEVKGARNEGDALKAASAVANSMLVKTALYGKDPNWGRIIAAVGYSGIDIDEENIDICLNNIKLVTKGTGTGKETAARDALSNKYVTLTIHLNSGRKSAKVLTCDLTKKYIEINAHYTT